MDNQAVKTVKEGLRAFRPVIKFHSAENGTEVIRQAVAADPRMSYYLVSYSLSGRAGLYELKVTYENQDTDIIDIRTVSSADECEELMCHYVGKYRQKLIAVAREGMEMKNAVTSFSEKHASFYPNLTSISSSSFRCVPSFTVYEFIFEYRIGRVKLAMMEQEVDEEVRRIGQRLFMPGLPNEAKIYLAHNYLTANVEFVKNHDNRLTMSYTQSAYGALIKKQCVCQGYAEAFKRLMDYCGIECQVIYGRTSGSSTLHAWNIVAPGRVSSYYHIDVTWDCNGGKPKYDYFCKNDAFFDGKRSWNREYNPRCAGSYPILAVARRAVMNNKAKLLAREISAAVLDC